MRIVQFDNLDSVISYPEEGVSAFGATVIKGIKVIGEYNGAQTDPTLEDYDGNEGAWPFVPPQQYQTEFTSEQFDRTDGIDWGTTDAEWAMMQDSNDQTIKKYLKDTLKRKMNFVVGQAPYTDLLAAMLGDNPQIINQVRHDELALGIPV